MNGHSTRPHSADSVTQRGKMHFSRSNSNGRRGPENGCIVEYICEDDEDNVNSNGHNNFNHTINDNKNKLLLYDNKIIRNNRDQTQDSSEKHFRKRIVDIMKNENRPYSADSRVQLGSNLKSTFHSGLHSNSSKTRNHDNEELKKEDNFKNMKSPYLVESGSGSGGINSEKERSKRQTILLNLKSDTTNLRNSDDNKIRSDTASKSVTPTSQTLGIHPRNKFIANVNENENENEHEKFLSNDPNFKFSSSGEVDMKHRSASANSMMRNTYVSGDGEGMKTRTRTGAGAGTGSGLGIIRPKTASSFLSRKVIEIRRDLKAMNALSNTDGNINISNDYHKKKKNEKPRTDSNNKIGKQNRKSSSTDDISIINKIEQSQKEMDLLLAESYRQAREPAILF